MYAFALTKFNANELFQGAPGPEAARFKALLDAHGATAGPFCTDEEIDSLKDAFQQEARDENRFRIWIELPTPHGAALTTIEQSPDIGHCQLEARRAAIHPGALKSAP